LSPDHQIENSKRFDAPKTSVVNGTSRETLNDIVKQSGGTSEIVSGYETQLPMIPFLGRNGLCHCQMLEIKKGPNQVIRSRGV